MPRAKTAAATPKDIHSFPAAVAAPARRPKHPPTPFNPWLGVSTSLSASAIAQRSAAQYGYFHFARIYVVKPFSDADLAHLMQHCRSVRQYDSGKQRFDQGEASFQPNRHDFGHYVEVKIPNSAALAFIAKRTNAVAYVEVAYDWVFDNAKDAHIMMVAAARSHITRVGHAMRYHFADHAWSSGRIVGCYVTGYTDKPCHLTGDANCYHHEIRVHGTRTLELMGISNAKQLGKLDFEQFWSKYGKLYDISLERLGRYDRNAATQTKSRVNAAQTRFRSKDAAYGAHVWRKYGYGVIPPSNDAQNQANSVIDSNQESAKCYAFTLQKFVNVYVPLKGRNKPYLSKAAINVNASNAANDSHKAKRTSAKRNTDSV